jgi:hypothetical protein
MLKQLLLPKVKSVHTCFEFWGVAALVKKGKITSELIVKMSDKKITQQTFGIPSTYSLIVKESEFTKFR